MSQISLNLFGMPYGTLAGVGQTIHDGFVTEVADYPLPIPTMPNFQSDIDDFNAAIAAWGVKGNRGSHTTHLALIAERTIIRNDLRMLANYAVTTEPENPDSWEKIGFKVRHGKTPPQSLQMVQNFRHFISRDVPVTSIKLRWKRPLDTRKSDVKGYVIQRSGADQYPEPDGTRGITNVVGLVPNTQFIDEDPFVGPNFYWVTPFNSEGLGVHSESVLVVSGKIKTA
jgi:hypothetical protein